MGKKFNSLFAENTATDPKMSPYLDVRCDENQVFFL